MLPMLLGVVALSLQPSALPVVVVTQDDTRIERSCIVRIPEGAVIADANGDGVIQIAAPGVTVEFEKGSVLRGAPAEEAPDALAGAGIAVNGHAGVTIRGARVSGYKVGLRAADCDGLVIEKAEFKGNYRQRLRSTAAAEDGADWLFPHNNDGDEWATQHGAAVWIKHARDVTVRGVRVREGQNGIVLDRVNGSRVYDNDCSFLSGWGVAMWRSSDNIISRNALDFCVRGYSHGVYNRGQDSAGLLMFEQCGNNVIAENSITHGGDGIFGFAGKQAIGEAPAPEGFDYKGRGNACNIIVGNDLSYAPAHGLEMTFSQANVIARNRFVENAICGIWGGYSNDFLIIDNEFLRNGEMAYGLERGGINIEHGSGHVIVNNRFGQNACGVHLWWDDDAALLQKPGVKANDRGVSGNIVAANRFEQNAVALQLRDASEGKAKVRGTAFAGNEVSGGRTLQAEEGIEVLEHAPKVETKLPQFEVLGSTKPVGARAALAGRENIIMTAWGPWDHQGPLVRAIETTGSKHIYEFRNIDPDAVTVSGVNLNLGKDGDARRWTGTIATPSSGIAPYTIRVRDGEFTEEIRGTILSLRWTLAVFPWEGTGKPEPPADLDAWRALASGERAVMAETDALSLAFGSRGPSELGISPEVRAAAFKRDYFGVVARASVPLAKGKWRVVTRSDDGVRVIANGVTIIENWTHHGATRDEGIIELERDATVDLTVEYFEIYGGAVLDVALERAE